MSIADRPFTYQEATGFFGRGAATVHIDSSDSYQEWTGRSMAPVWRFPTVSELAECRHCLPALAQTSISFEDTWLVSASAAPATPQASFATLLNFVPP